MCVSKQLKVYYKSAGLSNQLEEAISYAVHNSGKQYRPYLLWASSSLFSGDESLVFKIASILEILHTYSLIHDDLPAMDNDDMRHGKYTVHKKYNEALAILVGDSLLTDAFYFLSELREELGSTKTCKVISTISKYLGKQGMILGQALDIESKTNLDKSLNKSEVLNLHYLKTGKFMELATLLGGLICNQSDEVLSLLAEFGKSMGLAFQIQDDIQDYNLPNQDHINICSTISINEAKEQAISLINKAVKSLSLFKVDNLLHLNNFANKQLEIINNL